MKTSDYIAALMVKTAAESYAELGRLLGVPRSSITQYRQEVHTFDDDTARRVAEILKVDGSKVLADMAAQRAKSRDDKKYWTGLGTAAAVAMIAISTAISSGTPESIQAGVYNDLSIHYAHTRMERRVRKARILPNFPGTAIRTGF